MFFASIEYKRRGDGWRVWATLNLTSSSSLLEALTVESLNGVPLDSAVVFLPPWTAGTHITSSMDWKRAHEALRRVSTAHRLDPGPGSLAVVSEMRAVSDAMLALLFPGHEVRLVFAFLATGAAAHGPG